MNARTDHSANWPLQLAWLILTASFFLVYPQGSTILFLLVAGHIGYSILRHHRVWTQTPGRILANLVTLIRCALLVWLSLDWHDLSLETLAGILWLAAILDGLDGWVARNMNGLSSFGGQFDEEVDALFVLVACFLIWKTDMGSWWMMIAGWSRYVVVIVKSVFPPKQKGPSRFPWARFLAGISFVLLPLPLLLQGVAGLAIQIMLLCLILYSFTRELILIYGYSTAIRHLPKP